MGVALLVGAGVAVWQARLPTTYSAVAAIPVRGESSSAGLRDALEGSGLTSVRLDRGDFRLTPTRTDRDAMQRSRAGPAGCVPRFSDSKSQVTFYKFMAPQREIRVTACGRTPEQASWRAASLAVHWVRFRRQRLARVLDSLGAELELRAAVIPETRDRTAAARGLVAALGAPELERLEDERVDVAAPDLRSPHPIRDGATTSAAIVLLALGAFVATRKQGTGAEARPKSGRRRWLRRL
jgi:hypothetical protein